MMCTSKWFKLVYDESSMPKLRWPTSCIASLSNMTVASVCSSKRCTHKTMLHGSISSRSRREKVPEANTRDQTQYLHHARCTPRKPEKACASVRQVPCAVQEKVDDLISERKMSACQIVGGILCFLEKVASDATSWQYVPIPQSPLLAQEKTKTARTALSNARLREGRVERVAIQNQQCQINHQAA